MARILSIHAGKTRAYSEQDKSFLTAIRKQELVGPVRLTCEGVEGNEVANHKNAVFAYCAESYVYWNETLQPAKPWTHGLVGENLTIEGIDESHVYIGDFFKIGAITLQVSGCREPCANFLWHVQMPVEFLSTYQASGRTGIYLEVIEPGVIQSGDHVEHVSCGHDSISVPDLARFFMNPQPEAAELDRLSRIPGLGLQMLSSMMATRNLLTEKKLVRSNRWSGWKPFFVQKIVQETQDIKSFYLRPVDGAPVAGYRAGQFLTIRVTTGDGEAVTRCWSLSAYDEHLRGYRISIKKEAQGLASSWMHEQLAEGDLLELLPPNGRFTLQRGAIVQPVVLISGGVGITPMVSMLHAHVARADKRLPTLYFIHATHSEETHAFKDEVETVVAQYPQFHSHYAYSSIADSRGSTSQASARRLDKSELRRILSDIGSWFSEKWVPMGAESCAYYLCGPQGFMDAMRGALVEMGVPETSIAQESFTGGLGSLDHLQIAPATVQFARSAKTASWRQEDDLSLLEMAEQQGLRPNFSCRNGQCGLCRATLLHGEVVYPSETDADVAEGDVLLCCAIPKGDVVLDL